ncbi:MAG: hypothetical protein QG608_2166, partial [Actinomycetota bacterium]|nr:hypothetical protein [Actinomycetota bacterium]
MTRARRPPEPEEPEDRTVSSDHTASFGFFTDTEQQPRPRPPDVEPRHLPRPPDAGPRHRPAPQDEDLAAFPSTH